VIPRNVFNWKKHALDNFEELFSNDTVRDYQDKLKFKDAEVSELHKKIGELTVNLDWLKKKLEKLDLSQREALIELSLKSTSAYKTLTERRKEK